MPKYFNEERYFDEVIAPRLRELAVLCDERGIGLLALTAYARTPNGSGIGSCFSKHANDFPALKLAYLAGTVQGREIERRSYDHEGKEVKDADQYPQA